MMTWVLQTNWWSGLQQALPATWRQRFCGLGLRVSRFKVRCLKLRPALPKPSGRLIILFCLTVLSSVGCGPPASNGSQRLTVACAASLQKPITELAMRFQKQHAVQIDLQFAGTSTLINQAQLTQKFNVLISADQFSTDQLIASGHASECLPIVVQTPVIATAKMNRDHVTANHAATKVTSKADLFRSDLRVGLGHIEASSIGKATQKGLGDTADQLFKQAAVTRTTVTALATDLQVGSLDAAIIWDSTATQFQLSSVADKELSTAAEIASACVMNQTDQHQMAQNFVRFLANSKEADQVFSDLMFQRPKRSSAAHDHQAVSHVQAVQQHQQRKANTE